jgi:BMFP domain-containing protein YqiC
LIVVTENNITIVDKDLKAVNSIRLSAEARQADYCCNTHVDAVVTYDTHNRVNIVVHNQNGFTNITSLETELSIQGICVTDNLDEYATDIAFDVYVLHSKGLGYFSVKTADLHTVMVEAPVGGALFEDNEVEPDRSLESGTLKADAQELIPLTDGGDDQNTSAIPSAAQSPFHSGTPEPTIVNRRSARQPTHSVQDAHETLSGKTLVEPESVMASVDKKVTMQRGKPLRKDKEVDVNANSRNEILESYNREQFKERTYHLSDLLQSGQVVSRQEYDSLRAQIVEMKVSHRSDVQRLEQRIDKLYERLNKMQPKRVVVSDDRNQPQERERKTRKQDQAIVSDVIDKSREVSTEPELEPSPSPMPKQNKKPSEGKMGRREAAVSGGENEVDHEADEKEESGGPYDAQEFECEVLKMTKLEKNDLSGAVSKFLQKCKVSDLRLENSSYHDQLLIMSAMACVSLGAQTSFIENVTSFLDEVVNVVNPRLPEFQRDPTFFASVVNRTKSHLRSVGSTNPSVAKVISRLQSLIALVY